MLALTFPAIDPVLVEFGPVAIRWYSLAYVAGILLGWRYAILLSPRSPAEIAKGAIDDFALWATLGVIIGGRLGYVLFYKPGYYINHLSEIPAMWNGGMSFHGGALGVVIAAILFCRKRSVPMMQFGDLIAAATPIGLFFGRIANFINGELFGRVTEPPLGMVFPNGGPLPRHPSQLYEAALEGLLLFIILSLLVTRGRALEKPGLITGVFCAGYGVSRYLVEFVREPDAHLGILFNVITMGQLLSLPVIGLGVWLIIRARRNS